MAWSRPKSVPLHAPHSAQIGTRIGTRTFDLASTAAETHAHAAPRRQMQQSRGSQLVVSKRRPLVAAERLVEQFWLCPRCGCLSVVQPGQAVGIVRRQVDHVMLLAELTQRDQCPPCRGGVICDAIRASCAHDPLGVGGVARQQRQNIVRLHRDGHVARCMARRRQQQHVAGGSQGVGLLKAFESRAFEVDQRRREPTRASDAGGSRGACRVSRVPGPSHCERR